MQQRVHIVCMPVHADVFYFCSVVIDADISQGRKGVYCNKLMPCLPCDNVKVIVAYVIFSLYHLSLLLVVPCQY